MKCIDLQPNETVNAQLLARATGLAGLQLDHLATTIRIPSPHGTIHEDGETWLEYDERALFRSAMETARRWLAAYRTQPGRSFVMTSGGLQSDRIRAHSNGRWEPLSPHIFSGYGNGKTTIAEALFYSCGLLQVTEETGQVPEGEKKPLRQLHLYPLGKMHTAREWLQQLSAPDFQLETYLRPRPGEPTPTIVIDDIGREGALPFIRGADQAAERQARYYDIINHCYTAGIGVIITSNFRMPDLANYLGGATWSRLLEMVPEGYMIDITGVRDFRPIAGGRLAVAGAKPDAMDETETVLIS